MPLGRRVCCSYRFFILKRGRKREMIGLIITTVLASAAGILLLIFVCFSILHQRNRKTKQFVEFNDKMDVEDEEKQKVAKKMKKMKSVTPLSLALLGMIATIAELSTALPYFAFLAILLNHQLNVIELIIILIIYNLIYSSPLMLLYFVYRLKQDLFERLYLFMKRQMQKWSVVLLPLMLSLAGIAIFFHGIYSLIR